MVSCLAVLLDCFKVLHPPGPLYAEPGAPGVVKAEADKTSITLTWVPPSSPNGRLLEYEVIYSGYKEEDPKVLKC